MATDKQGFPKKELFLYDVATEMELQGLKVKFLSAKDIKEYFQKYHPNFDEEKVDIYKMTLFFIKMHKGSSFFFDEVSFFEHGEYLILSI